MPKALSPSFQFYPGDFLSDSNVQAMSLEACGAYIRLLSHCWNDASLPTDPDKLARLCGATRSQFARLWPEVAVCFTEQDGRYVQKRLDKERQKQDAFHQSASARGILGNQVRWGRGPSAIAKASPSDPSAIANGRSSSSSSSSSSKNTPPTPSPGGAFEDFWQAYPRKTGKDAARRWWHTHRPDAATVEAMLAALLWQQAQHDWLKDGGRFIPHPTTWLNAGRWKDEAPAAVVSAALGWEPFQCPHDPECHGRAACALKTALDAAKAGV